MDSDLQRGLDENAKQWLALSYLISAAEQVAYDKIHDEFLTTPVAPIKFIRTVFAPVFQPDLQGLPLGAPQLLGLQYLNALGQQINKTVLLELAQRANQRLRGCADHGG